MKCLDCGYNIASNEIDEHEGHEVVEGFFENEVTTNSGSHPGKIKGREMKTLEFKSNSPFFELCRDGQKPFDIRLRDPKDKRFQALSQLPYSYALRNKVEGWGITFTHPLTGESFTRHLLYWMYLPVEPNWVIIYLGELVK